MSRSARLVGRSPPFVKSIAVVAAKAQAQVGIDLVNLLVRHPVERGALDRQWQASAAGRALVAGEMSTSWVVAELLQIDRRAERYASLEVWRQDVDQRPDAVQMQVMREVLAHEALPSSAYMTLGAYSLKTSSLA